MLNVYDIMLYKESVKNEKIIYVQFGRHDFVFRTISPKEYTQAKFLTTTKEEFNDAICQLALLYPDDFDFSQSPIAGLSDSVSEDIIKASLIHNDIGVIEAFESSKEKLGTFLMQCTLFIKAAFPEYRLEEIEEWSYEKLMDMTAKAEFVLKLKGSQVEIQYNKDDLEEAPVEKSDKELILNGIDPMFYNSDKIQLKNPLVDYPIIHGSSWDNEELIYSVREQILGRQKR